MKEKRVKKRGDRHDGYLIHTSDPLHLFMPYLLGNRTDNEAVMTECVDLSAADAYLTKINEERKPEHPYTLFHLFCAALAKVFALRPKMNYFIQNGRMYERADINFSFVAKRKFADNGEEALIIMKMDEEDGQPSPLQQAHDKVCAEVYKMRQETSSDDGTTEQLAWMTKLPRFVLKGLVRILKWMDRTDRLPKVLNDVNPYNVSVFITNLGSIKMSASYHHLTNFGTNSFFFIIGEKQLKPSFDEKGNVTMTPHVDFGATIDERIGDGFYFAKSLKLLKYLFNNPELLDKPLDEPVDWTDK